MGISSTNLKTDRSFEGDYPEYSEKQGVSQAPLQIISKTVEPPLK
jgi:hypothetical protein